MKLSFIANEVIYFVQHSRRKCDFGSSLRDDEIIDFSIDDAIVAGNRFHSLVGKVNERSVVIVMKVTKKKWRSIVASSDISYNTMQTTGTASTK